MKIVSNKIAPILGSNVVVVLLLVYFYIFSVDLRFITGDEGYFAYASKEVLLGKVPYKDFFFPQSFLYPYILATWSYFVGESWQSFRLFCAIIATGIGFLLFDIIRIKRGIFYAALGVLLFISCDLVIAYFTIIKNYALPIFFLLLALRLFESKLKYKYLFIGFLLAISFQIRSYLIVCELPFLYLIIKNDRNILITRNISLLLLGNLICVIPTFIIMAMHFDEFIFNNLTYHSLRNRAGLITGFKQKLNAFYSLFQGVQATGNISIQYVLLISLIFLKRFYFKNIYLLLSIILIIVSFLPTPVFMQYFVMTTPFLIIYFCTNNNVWINRQVYNFFFGLILSVYIITYFVEFQRYSFNGVNVSGIYARKTPTLWRPKNLDHQISNVANKLYLEEGINHIEVFSSWPGYLVGMKAVSLKGLENHFARNIAHKLSDEEKIKYKVFNSEKDWTEIIKNNELKYIILGYRDKKHTWQRIAKKNGYKMLDYKIIKLMYFSN